MYISQLGLYSLLGFGIPLIITIITAIMDQTLNTNFLRLVYFLLPNKPKYVINQI